MSRVPSPGAPPLQPGVQAALDELPSITTLQGLTNLINSLSANATSPNAVLYSGSLGGGIDAQEAAVSVANQLGWSVIDNTARGQFLDNPAVRVQIVSILLDSEGLTVSQAQTAAGNLLYGALGDTAAELSTTYFGEASQAFVASIQGQVLVIDPNAGADRILGQLELPGAEANAGITQVNGIPRDDLIGNPNAFSEIQQASQNIIGADGLDIVNPNASGNSNFVLTEEGGARLGIPTTDLPAYTGALELPGFVPLADSTAAVGELAGLSSAGAPSESAAVLEGASSINLGTIASGTLEALGTAAIVYDAVTSAAQAQQQLDQGNTSGAAQTLTDFAARLVFGLEGAEAGAAAGAALFSETGPGAVVAALIGGIAGGIAGGIGGQAAVDSIWTGVQSIIDIVTGQSSTTLTTTPDDGLLTTYQNLTGMGVPIGIADQAANLISKDWLQLQQSDPSLTESQDASNIATAVSGNQSVVVTPGGPTVEVQLNPTSATANTSTLYDTNGNPIATAVVNADGSTTAVSYGGQGVVLNGAVIQPDGSIEQSLTNLINSDGVVASTSTIYNPTVVVVESETETHNPDGSTTIVTTNYDPSGAVTGSVAETITANSEGGYQSISDFFNAAGVLQGETTQTVDPNGNSSSATVNADGTKTTVTDNGSQTVSSLFDTNGQLVSQNTQSDTQNDVGAANPSSSSTIFNSYNTDGTLASTTTTNSDGIQSTTNFFYGSGGYGGYGGYGGAETGSATTSQDPYGVSTDTISTNGSMVTEDFVFTNTATGDTQETTTVTTTNSDGSKTVETTSSNNGSVSSTAIANYNANGGLVSVNSTDFQNGVAVTTSTTADSYNSAGQIQESVETTQSGGATDTTTSSYSYFANGDVSEAFGSEQYSSPEGSFFSQTNSFYAQDGTPTISNAAFVGDGIFAPQPSPPQPTEGGGSGSDSGGDRGSGGYAGFGGDGSAGSDGGGGSYSGGGYSFVGTNNPLLGGANSSIGVVSQFDLTNGSPIAGLIAQNASSQAYAAIAASQTSSAPGNAVLEGAAWDSKVVTWSFANGAGPAAAPFSNSIVSQYQATVEQAFATWGAATGITFEEVSDSTSSDIRVGWGDFQTTTSGVVGYTNYRSTNGALNGAIVRLEDPTQDPLTVGPTGQLTYEGTDATLLQVAEHEIGHALGFADDSDPFSILYAVASSANQTFDATDLAGIALLYGGSSPPSQTALASTGSSAETFYNGANQLVIADTKNPDGSSNDVSYSYNSDGSYVQTAVTTPAGSSAVTTTVSDVDAQGQIVGQQSFNADGSTDSQTWTYSSDGSYIMTDVHTPSGGGTSTTTTQDFNAQGQIVGQQSTEADGSTDSQTWTYNSDGSYIMTDVHTPSGGGTSTTTTQDFNAQGQIVGRQSTEADGSTDSQTWTYSSDGSYIMTDVHTPSGGGTSTTTTQDFNAQGQIVGQQSTEADGSTDSQTWTYNSDGSYIMTDVHTPSGGGTSTTTTQDFNAQGQIAGRQSTEADGSTDSQTWTYSSDGSYTTTDVHTPQGGGASTTTVDSYDQNNQLLSQNSYTPQVDGSYSDSWSKADGSQGTYWWNSSIGEYLDSWVNSNGSSFTDEYQYSSGGSPGVIGVSFTETYSGSDGSSGTRQYDAATNVTTINWVSSQVGAISSASSGDAGFIGLSQDGELTNTQPDLSFFNPNVSPVFNTLLSEHH